MVRKHTEQVELHVIKKCSDITNKIACDVKLEYRIKTMLSECTCASILKTHGVLLTSKGYGRTVTDSKKSSMNKQGYDTVAAEGTCKQIRLR